jgi:hypothetical protein
LDAGGDPDGEIACSRVRSGDGGDDFLLLARGVFVGRPWREANDNGGADAKLALISKLPSCNRRTTDQRQAEAGAFLLADIGVVGLAERGQDARYVGFGDPIPLSATANAVQPPVRCARSPSPCRPTA